MVTGEVLGDINGVDVTSATPRSQAPSARNIVVLTWSGALRETVTLHPTAHIDGDVLQQNLIIANLLRWARPRIKDPAEVRPVPTPQRSLLRGR
jgi:hypothetical protein